MCKQRRAVVRLTPPAKLAQSNASICCAVAVGACDTARMAPQQSNLKAALWMAGSITSFLVMSIAGRETTAELDVFQVLELRSVIGFFILLPLVFMVGGFSAMRTKRPLQHLGRNVAHFAGQAAWLYALTLIPLGELVSIEFTTPIWTALLAVFFLGEKLSRARIAAIVLGLVGIVVIVRPGVGAAETGHLIVLGAAFAFGISLVMVKSLTRSDSVVKIIFWMLVIQSVIGLYPRSLAGRIHPQSSGRGFSSSPSQACRRISALPARSFTRTPPSSRRWTSCGCRSRR